MPMPPATKSRRAPGGAGSGCAGRGSAAGRRPAPVVDGTRSRRGRPPPAARRSAARRCRAGRTASTAAARRPGSSRSTCAPGSHRGSAGRRAVRVSSTTSAVSMRGGRRPSPGSRGHGGRGPTERAVPRAGDRDRRPAPAAATPCRGPRRPAVRCSSSHGTASRRSGQSLVQDAELDPQQQPGQRRAEAGVHALPESQVRHVPGAVEVELVRGWRTGRRRGSRTA